MIRFFAVAAAFLVPAVALAQVQPGPPGPYVIDVRGAMVGLPNAGQFYPALPTEATIPGRAFGFDLGGHVIGRRLGASRVGLGGSVFHARGKVGPPDITARVTAVSSQVSFNFGTSDGWSYLGGGYGVGMISTGVSGAEDATLDTGTVGTLNIGGGARWFTGRRTAVGFDVRLYRFGASATHGTPATMRMALSVGLSLR